MGDGRHGQHRGGSRDRAALHALVHPGFPAQRVDPCFQAAQVKGSIASEPKTRALILLGVVSFVGPLLEILITGKVEDLSKFDLATTIVSIPLIFWWYHVDKREHDYHAGPLIDVI